ncbi:MAG: type II 3-dehydroquinate dehydratase [Myxococcaceae bacterium]|nr:type II 3-dehydroquinate dehydratase [Myxococcaceae bacterium]
MTHRVLVLHGPLLDLEAVLGQPLSSLDEALVAKGEELGLEVDTIQAIGEAELVKALLERREGLTGVVVNPSSLAPTAYTLADALTALGVPSVEVQLQHDARSRGRSALKRVVDKQFHGHGVDGYFKALASLAKGAAHASDAVKPPAAPESAKQADADEPGEATPPARGKTIGRKPPPPAQPATAERSGKTIGRRPSTAVTAAPSSATPPAPAGAITRAMVKAQLSARLSKTVSPEDFAAWARTQWLALQRGAPAEPGHKDALEELLLMLSTTAKASDHVILSYAAKLP